jgi:tetratricopeptide (TPR) repeat protein
MFRQALALLPLLLLTGTASAQSDAPIFLDHRPGEDDGIVDISEVIDHFPKKVVQEYEQALADARKGNRASATTRLQEVVKLQPDFYAAHNALGILYQRASRYREAEAEYLQASQLNPRSAAPFVNLASLFIEEAEDTQSGGDAARGILNDALGHVQQALKLQPSSGFAHYLAGIVFFKTAFYEEAEDHFQRALESGQIGFARLALANIYLRTQEWDYVIEQLDAYLRENRFASNRDQVRRVRELAVQKLEATQNDRR